MRFGFRFGGFHLFGLPSHGVSFALRAGGLFRTFAEAAVVTSCACIRKPLGHLPCRWANAGLSDDKKKKKKKKYLKSKWVK